MFAVICNISLRNESDAVYFKRLDFHIFHYGYKSDILFVKRQYRCENYFTGVSWLETWQMIRALVSVMNWMLIYILDASQTFLTRFLCVHSLKKTRDFPQFCYCCCFIVFLFFEPIEIIWWLNNNKKQNWE